MQEKQFRYNTKLPFQIQPPNMFNVECFNTVIKCYTLADKPNGSSVNKFAYLALCLEPPAKLFANRFKMT